MKSLRDSDYLSGSLKLGRNTRTVDISDYSTSNTQLQSARAKYLSSYYVQTDFRQRFETLYVTRGDLINGPYFARYTLPQ